MSNYITIAGDTFEKIARKKYGDDKKSGLIRSANPGILGPLTPGLQIFIPQLPNPNLGTLVKEDDPNETQIIVNGSRFRYWERIRISRFIDSYDVADFTAQWSEEKQSYRDAFKPLNYQPMEIYIGDELIQTGTMVVVPPAVGIDNKSFGVASFSQLGILAQCARPASSYPLEYKKQYLEWIAVDMVEDFGFGVTVDADPGAKFKRVKADPTQTIWSFLAGLARQRGLIMTSTPQSNLLFKVSTDAGSPVASLKQGQTPLQSITPSITPQGYFSHITGLKSVRIGDRGSQYTVSNPHLPTSLRPTAFRIRDARKADPKVAVEAKMARMFGSAINYTVVLDTWRDPQGDLWKPDTTIKVEAPGAMIYNPYEFLIREVELHRDGNRETAVLQLVLPGAYSSKIPEALPWD
jgi:prophage tail gpP-like protein